ncbi:hypothetical protein [Picosynechococcus sp. NKBG042902]|uniref:hypothetical protein n=1 Tax=Picosynechococcus sp. NKBG042902 TaxID=490193 RepID=UPI000A679372|nr:hypothetical protein [Picosynechococcus sp. NKBG042902]
MTQSHYPSNLPIQPTVEPNGVTRLLLAPHPTLSGTSCLLAGLILAFTLYPSAATPTGMARISAIAVGIALLINIFFDSRKGFYNLFRTDLLCLLGLYGLTLLEFLFPQEEFNLAVDTIQTAQSLDMVLLGMAGLALGRHLVKPKPSASQVKNFGNISSSTLFRLFVISASLGFLYMLLSVQFNPIALINAMIGPRFAEPWARGKYGGWFVFLSELALLIHAIPPMFGVMWNRRNNLSNLQKWTTVGIFGLVLFQGFTSGTRNIFVVYVATALIGYLITLPRHTLRNTLFPVLMAVVMTSFLSYHMLEFRGIGLRNYITRQVYLQQGETRETFSVDYNLMSLGPVIEAFPEQHNFLGSEVISWALVKPIPRVLWPGKPEGLSISIEEVVGADGWTVATTFIGESYMMAGEFGVLAMALFFGSLAAWWNRRAIRGSSDYDLVIYALGFFGAAITMRSMFWLTTAILPVIALVIFRKFRLVR